MSRNIPNIDWKRVDVLIDLALSEDLDDRGDVTTLSVVPEKAVVTATNTTNITTR